ncbi:MAG TPA: phosphodiester glycosidase family protein [Terriglobales bacterium]|nr:phosphodiester glycosidase family protein [Terriglobales bacterium]
MMATRRSIHLTVFAVLAGVALNGQVTVQRPWRGVVYTAEKRTNPPEEIHAVTVDLNKVRVRTVPAGPDPDGPGKWQTTLMPTSKIAQREEFDIAVNGDFFAIPRGKDAEGEAAQKLFENGVPALATGPAMTDGKTWSTAEKARQCLVADVKGRIHLLEAATPPLRSSQVICGRDFLVVDGKAQFTDEGVTYKPGEFRNVNPRTAVGLDKKGKRLFLLVVDGRSELSRGMTYGQLAAEMVRLGAYTAINLDGGGSSTLVLREANGALRVMNKPSDKKERAVANVLGVTLKKK